MKIKVRLFAGLRSYLPSGSSYFECIVEIDGGRRIRDVVEKLSIPEKLAKLTLVNGKYHESNHILQEGDVLSIFPPLAGG